MFKVEEYVVLNKKNVTATDRENIAFQAKVKGIGSDFILYIIYM